MQQAIIPQPSGSIQSVHRAAALLKEFGEGAAELGVLELSRRVHLHKSTVSRLLATLASEGLLERVAQTDKYRLGYEFARLASQVPPLANIRTAARPFLTELAQRAGETVHLAVPDGDQVLNVEQVSGTHLVRDTDWVGRRTPLHCVANGKVLLAFRPAREARRVVSRPLPRFTNQTITSRIALRAELARVRKRGYATARGEIEEGLYTVAAPVRDHGGAVIAAVSVSGPAYRLTARRMKELAALTVEIADKVSARLGYETSQRMGCSS